MSETPYLLITLLLLGRLGRRGSAPQAGALALLAAQVRPAGLSLLPALLCAPLRARRWREAAWLGLPPLLGAAAWSLWSWKASGAVQEAVELRLSYGGLGWLRPLEVAADNAGFYLTALGSAHLPASWGGGAAGAALGLVLAALAARGVFLRLAKDPGDPESLLLLGGTALHAVWAWQYERYLIPLLPWAFWAVALGLGRRAPWALGTLLAGQVLFQSPRWVLGPSPWARPELARTYERLRADPDPSGALASVMHVRDGYHSRRPSLPLPEAEGPEELAALLKARRARLVLWQEGLDVGLSGRSPLAASLERAGRQLRDPRAFRLVFEEPREGATVYAPR